MRQTQIFFILRSVDTCMQYIYCYYYNSKLMRSNIRNKILNHKVIRAIILTEVLEMLKIIMIYKKLILWII